jgi:hypothetical protein
MSETAKVTSTNFIYSTMGIDQIHHQAALSRVNARSVFIKMCLIDFIHHVGLRMVKLLKLAQGY